VPASFERGLAPLGVDEGAIGTGVGPSEMEVADKKNKRFGGSEV
jgi:hypothetical protein